MKKSVSTFFAAVLVASISTSLIPTEAKAFLGIDFCGSKREALAAMYINLGQTQAAAGVTQLSCSRVRMYYDAYDVSTYFSDTAAQ
jgi:hypothetical protein